MFTLSLKCSDCMKVIMPPAPCQNEDEVVEFVQDLDHDEIAGETRAGLWYCRACLENEPIEEL